MPIGISQQAADALATANGGKLVEQCPAKVKQAPHIATTHILNGEINSKGKAVGFHHRPDGNDPAGSHLDAVSAGPNKDGVYEGTVQIFDPAKKKWVPKKAKSSFYPDKMTPAQIEQAIHSAYAHAEANGEVSANGKFEGDSGKGFWIGGYAKNGKIDTAYPIFDKD